jgi:beta-1,4-mannosyltransferase
MSPGPEISNPFISLLIRNLDADIEVSTFTWRDAFLGRYDVLHVHWPDALLKAPTPMRRVLKFLQLRALLVRNRVRGIRQVWTVHNLTPHETGGGRADRMGRLVHRQGLPLRSRVGAGLD